MGILLEKPTTFGAAIKANYHRIINFSVDAVSGAVSVQVASFESEAAHDAGASPFYVMSYNLVVNIMAEIEEGDVGKSIYDVVKELLEAGLLGLPDFAGGTIA